MDNSFVELLDVEKDSGMESVNSSKDETPERKTVSTKLLIRSVKCRNLLT